MKPQPAMNPMSAETPTPIARSCAMCFARVQAGGGSCEPVEELRWGTRSEIRLPGGGRLGLYHPKHPLAVHAASIA